MTSLYFIYRIFSFLLHPFLYLYLKLRIYNSKESSDRYKERFAFASLNKPDNKTLIWFHVASLGELNSIVPIISYITKRNKTYCVLVTTMTLTAAQRFRDLDIKNAYHQFVPLDSPICVNRFLKHWQPDLGIFVESEIWPNFLYYASKRCPLLLLNARMSQRSLAKWRMVPSTARFLFNKFKSILPATASDYENFGKLGLNNLNFIGNIKSIANNFTAKSKQNTQLEAALKGRKAWLCASTHEGEEEIALQVHSILKDNYPNLVTIIAPRHPERLKELLELAKVKELKVAIHSKNDSIKADTDIYIVDTIGELEQIYSVIDIVFVGGSLVNIGGHNILEPARLKCAIIVGPYTQNFADTVNHFIRGDALLEVQEEEELAATVQMLLDSPTQVKKLQDNALKLSVCDSKMLQKSVDNLLSFLRV